MKQVAWANRAMSQLNKDHWEKPSNFSYDPTKKIQFTSAGLMEPKTSSSRVEVTKFRRPDDPDSENSDDSSSESVESRVRTRKVPGQSYFRSAAETHARALAEAAMAKAAAEPYRPEVVPRLQLEGLGISGPNEAVPASYSAKRSRPESGNPTPRDVQGRAMTDRKLELQKISYYDKKHFPAFRPYSSGTKQLIDWLDVNRTSIPNAAETMGRMIEDNQVPAPSTTGLQLMNVPAENPDQEIKPPTSKQVGSVANSGTLDTIPNVVTAVSNATRETSSTTVAIAGSSTDSADAYRTAHAAAGVALVDVGPSSRVNLLYEAQMARALNESEYKGWSVDNKKREKVCADLTSSRLAIMDVDRTEQ